MRVFVTGATGFIGSVVVKDLIAAGHQVIGLCRSDAKAPALLATGAEVFRGSITEPEGLTEAASRADGVIHLAFNHDFSRFVQNCEDDRVVIKALASGLAGSSRPLVVTSGTAVASARPGEHAKEDDPTLGSNLNPRAATEEAAAAAAESGVNVSIMRLPQVHDPVSQGLISPAIDVFRAKGVCAYIGDGANRWPAAHYLDVARLYRLAVEKAEPNAKYHAVAEEGVTMREIVETIGARLGLPVKSIGSEETGAFFGWLSRFAAHDMPASSAQTRQRLGWTPTGPGLLEDLRQLPLAAG